MNRNHPAFLLAACCALLTLFSAPAARAASSDMSDAEVVRYLTPAQVAQWNEAAKNIKDGDAKVTEGQKLQAEQPDPNLKIQLNDIEADHTKGAALVRDGFLLKNQGTRVQVNLRNAARNNRENAKSAAQDTAAANYTTTTAQWPEAVQSMSASVYKSLSDLHFKHLYLADAYSFDEPKYSAKADLTADLLKQFTQLDPNGKIFDAKGNPGFKLASANGKLIVTYPDRPALTPGNTAAIVCEILFNQFSGYAAVSLRAVDLANLRIVANQTMMLSVDPSFGKKLGVPGFRIPSKRIVPPATSDSNAKPTPVLTINLQDPSGYLSLVKQQNGSYGVTTAGRPDTQENRFAILMFKSYMLDQQKQLNTSDVDFLIMTLSADKPSDLSTLPADVVGAWVLPNLSNISDNITLNPLKAREFSNAAGGEIEVGTLTITRDLPKLTPPTAADLMSTGTGK